MNQHVTIYQSKQYAESQLTSEIINLLSTRKLSYCIRHFESTSQSEFMLDIHRDLAVIIDCTVPKVPEEGSAYPILTAHINVLNHIVAYSRDVDDSGFEILPLNIVPQRRRTEKDNNLVEWIERQIDEIVSNEGVYNRLYFEDINDLLQNRKGMEDMMMKSLAMVPANKHDRTPIMISYRNKYAEDVEALKKKIEDEGKFEVKVLPPGSLCGEYEAHTPMRRWMLVGLLEDHIRTVKEVWVYLTEDYTESWWTIAEIVMTANLNLERGDNNKIRIKVYDPKKKALIEEKDFPTFIFPDITNEQHRKIARYLSNTRPDTMGPEMIQQVRQMKQLAKILRYSPAVVREEIVANLKESLAMSIPVDLPKEQREEMLTDLISMYSDPDELEKYASDEVFQEVFWKNLSYQVDTHTPAYVDGHIDVDAFMSTPMKELTKLDDTKLKRLYSRRKSLELSGKTYTINIGKTRYLWHATRMGQPTIMDAPGIEIIQTFDLKEDI